MDATYAAPRGGSARYPRPRDFLLTSEASRIFLRPLICELFLNR
jgi:hypothetical protein